MAQGCDDDKSQTKGDVDVTPTGRQRRPTSADVAREAGVSRTTVSYVLNGTPHQKIPEVTRQRVLDAVARLDYAPSAAARALQSGQADMVLFLLPNWPIGPSVGAMLQHLSSALARDGLTLLAHPRPEDPRTGDVWRTAAPAAVVTWGDVGEKDMVAMRAAGIPVTVAFLSGPGRHRGELEIPQQRIGRMQAEHLAATGHHRLGYAYPDDSRVSGFAVPRLAGVRAACAELGLDEPVVRTVPLDPGAAAHAVDDWRAAGVTAICAYNDDVAVAVLAGMRRRGLAAPGDLAVIGVDDTPVAKLADPPLTTVLIEPQVLAEHIAESIRRSVAGRPGPARLGSDVVQLVRRDSA